MYTCTVKITAICIKAASRMIKPLVHVYIVYTQWLWYNDLVLSALIVHTSTFIWRYTRIVEQDKAITAHTGLCLGQVTLLCGIGCGASGQTSAGFLLVNHPCRAAQRCESG